MNSDAEDRLALRELYDDYQIAIDTHEADPWVDLFASDGIYESPFGTATGRDELVAAISQWHSSGITAGKRHLLGPLSVTVDDDSATGHATYVILEVEESAGSWPLGHMRIDSSVGLTAGGSPGESRPSIRASLWGVDARWPSRELEQGLAEERWGCCTIR